MKENEATATVARGRTVDVPTGTRVTGYDKERGVEISGPILRSYGPGERVTLPFQEVARLVAAGFLMDARLTP